MSEETKNTGTEKKTAKTCCPAGAMQDFFQNMAPFCSGLGETPDCKAMMKSMAEKFCGQASEESKTGCGN
jgi:hypothetical protein